MKVGAVLLAVLLAVAGIFGQEYSAGYDDYGRSSGRRTAGLNSVLSGGGFGTDIGVDGVSDYRGPGDFGGVGMVGGMGGLSHGMEDMGSGMGGFGRGLEGIVGGMGGFGRGLEGMVGGMGGLGGGIGGLGGGMGYMPSGIGGMVGGVRGLSQEMGRMVDGIGGMGGGMGGGIGGGMGKSASVGINGGMVPGGMALVGGRRSTGMSGAFASSAGGVMPRSVSGITNVVRSVGGGLPMTGGTMVNSGYDSGLVQGGGVGFGRRSRSVINTGGY